MDPEKSKPDGEISHSSQEIEAQKAQLLESVPKWLADEEVLGWVFGSAEKVLAPLEIARTLGESCMNAKPDSDERKTWRGGFRKVFRIC
jgi:hypothetical protein